MPLLHVTNSSIQLLVCDLIAILASGSFHPVQMSDLSTDEVKLMESTVSLPKTLTFEKKITEL